MKRLASLLLLGATAAAGAGCDTEAYCFDCGEASSTGQGEGGGGGAGATTASVSVGSQASQSGISVGSGCGADLQTDEQNCGFCGNVCELANAFSECVAGFCAIDGCAPGWIDDDNIPDNGCEYACAVSADGREICDGLDNDCNGEIDEIFDLETDPLNCGECGLVCSYGNAEASCEGSTCSRGDCFVGFHDIDGNPDDCEYACTITNGGVEACDLADNDCDGEIDEGIDTTTDEENCGSCGFDCSTLYPNTVPSCEGSVCVLGPCLPGFYDIDLNELNGCEYACDPAVPGAEVCDGEDNDCNGFTDDGVLPGVGDPCGPTEEGECAFGVQVCSLGDLACSGAIMPAVEYCDGLDNDCEADVDEGCPAAAPADQRLDLGANSAVNQAVSTQLHATSQGDTVLAVWLDRRSGNADIRGSVSTDGGTTWPAADFAVSSAAQNEVEPWAALSPDRAYVTFGRFVGNTRQIFVASAGSPFTTFGAPVRADGRPGASDSFFPRVVVASAQAGSDDLVVVWQNLSGTGADVESNVFLQRSLDGGATWLPADVQVNEIDGSAEQPLLATDGAGRAYVAWRDQLTSEVVADVYDVAAGTLDGNQPISGGEPAENLAIAASPGTDRVVVAWTDLRAVKKAIRLNRSNDGGATWGADGVVVNLDSTFADSTRPDVAIRGADVAVAWEDTRSGQPDVYVNTSANGGTSFGPTSARADLGDVGGGSASFVPRIAFGSDDLIHVTWQDRRDGEGDVFYNHSFDGGGSFQPIDVRVDLGTAGAPSPPGGADSRSPFVFPTLGGDRATIVWIDNRTAAGVTGVNGDIYSNVVEPP